MTPEDLLRQALESEPDSPKRALLVAAAAELAAQTEVVLVGGSAVNLYVPVYQPTDIDLVGPPHVKTALQKLGFERADRHLRFGDTDDWLLVEIPGSQLEGFDDPYLIEVEPGIVARVISLDDLMMDRIRQSTDGSRVTFEDAVRLATGAYEHINWDEIHRRASEQGTSKTFHGPLMASTLKKVQRAAKKELRRLAQSRPKDSRL